ncbi:hypothetical protein [uncultured Duodenibacillus sp.]|uniref:hypothetical protein n=1 Tax=uncultured Duodenibacillus sp. TaxID=1980699 RepID=UPI002599B6F6|nr:hypothetical protein [uncultured Duodenibacillus sp.]
MDLQNRRVKRKTWSTSDNPAADYERYCECQDDEDEDEEDDDLRREIEAERRTEAAEARAAEREFRNYDPFGGP